MIKRGTPFHLISHFSFPLRNSVACLAAIRNNGDHVPTMKPCRLLQPSTCAGSPPSSSLILIHPLHHHRHRRRRQRRLLHRPLSNLPLPRHHPPGRTPAPPGSSAAPDGPRAPGSSATWRTLTPSSSPPCLAPPAPSIVPLPPPLDLSRYPCPEPSNPAYPPPKMPPTNPTPSTNQTPPSILLSPRVFKCAGNSIP